jgi:hypothetical protein
VRAKRSWLEGVAIESGPVFRSVTRHGDLEALRARLRRISDRELFRFGRAARYMCSPGANLGKEPRQAFVIQLRER